MTVEMKVTLLLFEKKDVDIYTVVPANFPRNESEVKDKGRKEVVNMFVDSGVDDLRPAFLHYY